MKPDTFRKELSELLTDSEFSEVKQIEQLMELAGAAQNERDLQRYELMELDLESLEEGTTPMHGFLRGAIELMRAKVGSEGLPFRDEFLVRLFMTLSGSDQKEIADQFWEEDASIALTLNKVLALNAAERKALLRWMDSQQDGSAKAGQA